MVDYFACLLSSNSKWIICDVEDAGTLGHKTWRIDSNGYAVHAYRKEKKSKRLYMHRAVMPKTDLLIDHVNMVRNDNRKSNLRQAGYALNRFNSMRTAIGVRYLPRFGKWSASRLVAGKHVSFGRYETKEEAYRAYTKGIERLYGIYII